ncbi:MAG: hypothetical protein J0H01_35410 [Rhizobiales bacterium]|nr:hypothetical protein [Hyphomicrobiales bacterium]
MSMRIDRAGSSLQRAKTRRDDYCRSGSSGSGSVPTGARLRSRGYVAEAQQAVQAGIQFPPGASVVWSGQYKYLQRAAARLQIVVPVTLRIIFLL